MADRLTLDTNLIREWLDEDSRVETVQQLLRLKDAGKVDLAVTARIHEDIWFPPLSDRLAELAEVGIAETGSVARLGFWQLGRDHLGDSEFVDWVESLNVKEPDWRDFDHLHAHMLQNRDFFLTWDSKILHFRVDLSTLWRIEVQRPEEYLEHRFGVS
ncbi:MAG TPA: hypothetical protein VFO17_04000 [Acidimicrobiia bacterium]|jgi:hypothetical protein|nr:hypothetical protein [Acidimicrobiia bacterium]